MTNNELVIKLNEIRNDDKFTPVVYAILKNNDYPVKKITFVKSLEEEVKKIVIEYLNSNFINEETDFQFLGEDQIQQNSRKFYEIKKYEDFKFPFPANDELNDYKESDQQYLNGFLVKISLGKKHCWLYQKKYQISLINHKTSLYAFFNREDKYEKLDVDVVKFDRKFDWIFIDDSIITNNISLLQKDFHFDSYSKRQAKNVLSRIKVKNIISPSDVEKIKNLVSKEMEKGKLTTVNKLLQIRNSAVLDMETDILISKISDLDYYSTKLLDENKNIKLSTKNINLFLKMLNDDLLKSELTDKAYDSPTKENLNLAVIKGN